MSVTPLPNYRGNALGGRATETDSPQDDGYEVLFPVTKDVTLITNDKKAFKVTIEPFLFRDLPAVIRVTAPIMDEFKKLAGTKDALTALKENAELQSSPGFIRFVEQHNEAILEFIAVLAKVDRELLDNAYPDSILDLFLSCIEVNLDFFIKRLGPMLRTGVEALLTILARSTGLIPSKTS